MEKELITLSFAFFSPTNFEFKLACEHGSCESLRNILSSTVALVFIFICFVFAFCLMCYTTGFKYGLQYKGDVQTSIHLDRTEKRISQENSQLSSAKYRRNIRTSVSKEFDPVRGVHKVIVGEVQGHTSTTCVTNPVPAQRSQIKSHSNADIRNIGRRGQRNPNRFQTRTEDFVTCSAAKHCVNTDADSPVISISSDMTYIREGLKGQRKHNIFRTRAKDLAQCTDAKFFLPSNTESPDIFESSDKTEVRGAHKRKRQRNRFHTRAADQAPCTDAKPCFPSNADRQASFVSSPKTNIRGGCKRELYSSRFHTKAAYLVPCNGAKVVLPSYADSPGRTISREKTDVRGEEPQEEKEWETASDDTGNESSKEEVDSDIQTDSDCLNDPYGDSASFFLETCKASDLETDAISSDEPTEKDDTEDNGLNSDKEPGNCVQDRGGLPRSQHNIRKNKKFQMRKTKMSCPLSAKRSGETIVKGENIMIGKKNTLILMEDSKCSMTVDGIKQMLDGLSTRISENSMKFDTLMQKLDELSATVFEFSRKPNCIQSVYAERGIFAVPCNYVQNVASAASKFRHCYACCWNNTSAEGLYKITSEYDAVEMPTNLMNPHKDPCSSNVPSEQCDHISGTEMDTEILICRR